MGLPASELHRRQSARPDSSTQRRQCDSLQELQREHIRRPVTTFVHQVVVQDEILLVSKCLPLPGQHGCRGARQDGALPGGRLWQLLHNNSENHQLIGTAHLIMPKRSCDGIPRQLSHCHSLDLSLPHTSFGFLKEVELFFIPLKCVEAHGLNGREGELTSSAFPLLANGLCLTLRVIQEQGGIFVTP